MGNYRPYKSASGRRDRTSARSAKSTWDYFYPFLFIIAVGIILFLFYQLGKTWIDQGTVDMRDKIVADIETGTAKILPWGQDEWQNLYDNSTLLEGDKVRVEDNSQLVLKFFDGGAVRSSEQTQFEIKEKSHDKVVLELESGRVWIFPPAKQTEDTVLTFNVEGKLASVSTDNNSEFAFASLNEDAVRVFSGVVSFNAKDINDKSYQVGVGQQIVINVDDVAKLTQGQSLSFLKGIDEEYKQREWYKVNVSEDPRDNPGEVVTSSGLPALTVSTGSDGVVVSPVATPVASAFKVATPVVTSHKPEINSNLDKEIINGTVAADVFKVRVDHIHGGQTFSHVLGRYSPGSKVWNYVAVAGADSNMKPGKNVYEVYAYDQEGNISDKAVLTINYSEGDLPASTAEPAVSDAAVPVTGEPMPTTVPGGDQPGASAAPTPSPQISRLSAPTVVTFNDVQENTTMENKVKVVGTVDPKSIRVFVNGFALTGYRSGEPQWVYYAAEKYSTLTMGKNTYRVYSVDAEGNKSAITEFEITRIEGEG